MDSQQIRQLQSDEEFQACAALQERVWGEDDELVSARDLKRAERDGGILLGAFSEVNRLDGFVLSYRIEGTQPEVQHSHMLAVDPVLRDQGIGLRLKEAQFAAARARGARWLVWTFDPLEARNSHLNLNKLGTRARAYFEDFYPGSRSILHAGLATDRLLAEKSLAPVKEPPIPGQEAEPLHALQTARWTGELPVPGEPLLGDGMGTVLIEIPWDIQGLKLADPRLATCWREATRQAFRHYLRRGFVASGLVRQVVRPPHRAFHLLRFAPAAESVEPLLDLSSRPFSARRG